MPFLELPESTESVEWVSEAEEFLMAASMTITEGFSGFGLADVKSLNFTGSGGMTLDESIPASTSNHPLVFSLDVSAIKAIFIMADAALLLETNDSGTPDDTITLVANQPYIWYTGSYFANELTTDVTALYATNGTANAVSLVIRVVTDATP